MRKYVNSKSIKSIKSITVIDKVKKELVISPEVPEKKNFFGRVIQKFQPAGYYLNTWQKIYFTENIEDYVREYNENEFNDNLMIISGEVYIKYHINILYNDKNNEGYYFDTYDEALEMGERLSKLCGLILISEK